MSKPVLAREQGDPNKYALLQGTGWVAHVQFNGELTSEAQRIIINAMALATGEVLNRCHLGVSQKTPNMTTFHDD